MTFWRGPKVVTLFTLITAAMVAHPAAGAQTRQLQPSHVGEASNTSPQSFTIRMGAGDILAGTLQLQGGSGTFDVYDPTGTRIRSYDIDSEDDWTVGFIASRSGIYRVELRVNSSSVSSYRLATRTQTPPERTAGLLVRPTSPYQSPRIRKLADAIQAQGPEAVASFWLEAAAGGGPIVEPLAGNDEEVLVTFLWRQTFETHNVILVRPPYGPIDYRALSRLPGSDVWFKTMRVHRTSRFAYTFAPNYKEPDGVVSSQTDPLNPRIYPDDVDRAKSYATSVLELDRAPDETWLRRIPTQRGSIVPHSVKSAILEADVELVLYTPHGFAAEKGPYPLVVLFDGLAYARGAYRAPVTLDNLIQSGRIRAPIVCFVSGTSAERNRARLLQNALFTDAIAKEVVPWLRATFAVSNRPDDVIIGGFSAGGGAAAFAAFHHPTVFGNVLLQSGGAPRNTALYRDGPKVPVRLYIDAGLYESVQIAHLPFDELLLQKSTAVWSQHFRDVLVAKGYEVIYKETGGGHDPLHVRATFAEALIALLGNTGSASP